MTATTMSSTFQVGRVGQALASITADDLAFVNDDQLLIVESDSRGTTVKAVRLGQSRDGGLATVRGGPVGAVAFFRPRNRTLASGGLGRR